MTVAQTQSAHLEGAWLLSATLRRVLLLGPPLAITALSAVHPRPDENAQAVMDVSTWFMAFHLIQLPLAGLVGLSVLLLADDFGRAAAWTTRLGVGAFLVFFSAYDSLAGIGAGLAMRKARELPAAQQDGVWATVKDWPAFELVPFSLNIVATLGWVLALGGVALAARRTGAPRVRWILIALAALLLLGGHPFPLGTLAFGCLFVAALLGERTWRPPTSRPA